MDKNPLKTLLNKKVENTVPSKKSKDTEETQESLEKKKLINENFLLEEDINDRKKEKEKGSRLWWRINSFAGWAATLVVSIGQIFGPLADYLEKRKNQMEFELDAAMIDLIKDDNGSYEVRKQTISLLSYYEYNSLPILLYYLENEENETVRKAVINSLKKVYTGSKRKTDILKTVNSSFDQFTDDIIDNEKFYQFNGYMTLYNEIHGYLSTYDLDLLEVKMEALEKKFRDGNLQKYITPIKTLLTNIKTSKTRPGI